MLLYNLVILLYGCVIRIASAKKEKARQWVTGRKDWRMRYQNISAELGNAGRIWFHCASYGEFEQGRPLIEALKKKYPGHRIILTFFSPSGYEAFRNWKGADAVLYLPLDTPSNARDFIRIMKPSCAVFIKYEFWVNHLTELRKGNIPTYLVSAVFKPHHPFFKWYGGLFRESLRTFKILFVQDKRSEEMLKGIGCKDVKICGDTRFDRVKEISENTDAIPELEYFSKDNPVLIAGSTWPGDNELLISSIPFFKKNRIKLILVPHEVDEPSVSKLEQAIVAARATHQLFTAFRADNDADILLINTVGLLARSYGYADFAYVGGFGGEWHNVLEPAVYGIPVFLFGKDEGRFNEITELIDIGAIKTLKSSAELEEQVAAYLSRKSDLNDVKMKLRSYFDERTGVTEKILSEIRF